MNYTQEFLYGVPMTVDFVIDKPAYVTRLINISNSDVKIEHVMVEGTCIEDLLCEEVLETLKVLARVWYVNHADE